MKTILCFGDSNTYGLIPATDKRYAWGERWTSRLSNLVEPHGYRVIEEGLCGRTTIFDDPVRSNRRGSALLPTILETNRPVDVIILMLGTNDCKTVYHASADQIGEGIVTLLDQIREYSPTSQVLLVAPIFLGEKVYQEAYDPEFSEASIAVSKELGAVYEKIAKKRGILFLRASDHVGCSEVDQEHLDADGHRKLSEAIFNMLYGCRKFSLG